MQMTASQNHTVRWVGAFVYRLKVAETGSNNRLQVLISFRNCNFCKEISWNLQGRNWITKLIFTQLVKGLHKFKGPNLTIVCTKLRVTTYTETFQLNIHLHAVLASHIYRYQIRESPAELLHIIQLHQLHAVPLLRIMLRPTSHHQVIFHVWSLKFILATLANACKFGSVHMIQLLRKLYIDLDWISFIYC
jgi:hypothetical protein